MEKRSMPGPAPSVYSPLRRCGMPQANSTTSRPRCTSPLASAKVLPCSEDRSRREAVEFLLREVEELHQHARAPLRVRGRPGRLRSLGDRYGVLDLGMLGEGHFGLHLAGIGIEHVAEASRSPLHLFAADEVADLTHELSPWIMDGSSAVAMSAYCAAFFRSGHEGGGAASSASTNSTSSVGLRWPKDGGLGVRITYPFRRFTALAPVRWRATGYQRVTVP